MKKIIIWSVISIVIIGLAIGAFLWLRRPQIITLSDGTKLTLLGVEYGKHHKYPTVKLPKSTRRTGGGGSFDTQEDTLVVWILQEHKANDWPNYQTMVYDPAETGCVVNWSGNSHQVRPGVDIKAMQLEAFPRRDRKFFLRFSTWGSHGQTMNKGQFIVSNPARRSFPKWSPSSLPITQSDGDLDVTLNRFVYGVSGFNGGNRSSKDPMNKAVLTVFHTEQNGNVATNWQPVSIVTSDATGNKAHNNSWSNTRDVNGDPTMTYQWGLWPEEAAWKLRVEMSRTSGFTDDEIWSVTNVTVRPGSQQEMWNYDQRRRTNSAFAETTLNGIHLRLFPVIQFTDQNGGNGQKSGGFRITAEPDVNEGFRMSAVSITDENGRELQAWNGGSGGGSYSFQIPTLRNAKMLNITVALHKSRFVEFTAKPAKP